MNEMQVFENEKFGTVRTVMVNDEPWFVGKDVATCLAYKDTSDALKKHVDDEDKLTRRFADSGQSREMYIISESGLYSLILGSKLPTAKQFKHWVTAEVLPSIRKTGSYNLPQDYPSALRALADKCEEAKRLEAKSAAQEQVIHEMQPKVSYVDRILDNHGLVTITQIAKDYGMTGTAMNKLLHGLQVQYKTCNGQWLLYRKYQSEGYTHSKTHEFNHNDGTPDIAMTTEWTQKGRLFLYNLLKGQGIFPLVEQKSDARGERYAS